MEIQPNTNFVCAEFFKQKAKFLVGMIGNIEEKILGKENDEQILKILFPNFISYQMLSTLKSKNRDGLDLTEINVYCIIFTEKVSGV